MFTRSILIPSLLVCAICAPFLLSQNNLRHGSNTLQNANPNGVVTNGGYPFSGGQAALVNGIPVQPSAYPGSANVQLPSANSFSGMQLPNLPVQSQTARSPILAPSAGPVGQTVSPTNPAARLVPFGLVSQPVIGNPPQVQTNYPTTGNSQLAGNPPTMIPASQVNQIGPPTTIAPMTPDLMSAQTFIFPGNELGPDLNAQPMQFLPITDFREIFRFDVNPAWVKSRWKRISTNPGEDGLHGLRVALVTGTNSWDLHGSLTYYFDGKQQAQRITFRGWTGDATRLVTLLEQRYGFKSQETLLAGFYLAKSWGTSKGGMLMKHPPVIQADNPCQQLAIVMEINNPDGSSKLSDDFQLLIDGSQNR